MTTRSYPIPVALEIGRTRTFASALDWPGWARSGRDEAAALAALLAYGPRYQRALRSTQLSIHVPTNPAAFTVTERLTGDAVTDFGAPSKALAVDTAPVDAAERARLEQILNASWDVFGEAVNSANGKHLRRGPRGGGRTAAQLLDHVMESHYAYLRRIYWREPHEQGLELSLLLEMIKRAGEQALALAVSDEMPTAGPRGGALWKARYFVRRSVWHILDHTWEIEDRLEP